MARRPARICLVCGQVSGRPAPSGRCPDCQREYEEERPARVVYDSPRWRAFSRKAVADWVRLHGWWCPGWGVPGHVSRDLTCDHPAALAQGGEAFPRDPLILCRSCNGRKGATPLPATAARNRP